MQKEYNVSETRIEKRGGFGSWSFIVGASKLFYFRLRDLNIYILQINIKQPDSWSALPDTLLPNRFSCKSVRVAPQQALQPPVLTVAAMGIGLLLITASVKDFSSSEAGSYLDRSTGYISLIGIKQGREGVVSLSSLSQGSWVSVAMELPSAISSFNLKKIK